MRSSQASTPPPCPTTDASLNTAGQYSEEQVATNTLQCTRSMGAARGNTSETSSNKKAKTTRWKPRAKELGIIAVLGVCSLLIIFANYNTEQRINRREINSRHFVLTVVGGLDWRDFGAITPRKDSRKRERECVIFPVTVGMTWREVWGHHPKAVRFPKIKGYTIMIPNKHKSSYAPI